MIAFSSTHSQNISKITITSDQLKTANLIFAEHRKFSKLIPLLQLENTNLQMINKSWEKSDSIKTFKLNQSNQIINKQNVDISNMKKSIEVRNTITITSIGIALLCLILR